MKYRVLGRTGLKVSEIGFGGEYLLNLSEKEAVSIIHKANDNGINVIDCWMGDPVSRAYIGKGISRNRNQWYLQGQIGSTSVDGKYKKTRDVEECRVGFDHMLSVMGTDYADFGMISILDDPKEWLRLVNGPYIDFVHELKKNGKIRYVGLSTHNPVLGVMAAESGEIDMMLFSVNPAFDMLPTSNSTTQLWDNDIYDKLGLEGKIAPDRELLYRTCEKLNIGMTVMKTFAGGRLLSKERSPFGVALTPSQCIHYALTHPAVSSVLCGYGKMSDLDDALKYLTASDEEKDYASVLSKAPKHAYFGQCTYCGHCLPCPKNIDIPSVNKYYDLASTGEVVQDSLREHYKSLNAHASDCIGCKLCESRCPFGVKVSERMQTTREMFGF